MFKVLRNQKALYAFLFRTSPQIDMIIYNALLSNRALVDMVNLERCSEAAYNMWIMPELVRPPVQRSIFRRR